MERQALKKVAVRLNRGAVRGSSAKLARIMGVSQATVRSWLTKPEDETTYRRMNKGTRRLLATMVLLDGAGLLDEKFVDSVDTFDILLNEGGARLDHVIENLNYSLQAGDMNEEEED